MGRIFTDEEADAAPAAKPARRVFTDAEADAPVDTGTIKAAPSGVRPPPLTDAQKQAMTHQPGDETPFSGDPASIMSRRAKDKQAGGWEAAGRELWSAVPVANVFQDERELALAKRENPEATAAVQPAKVAMQVAPYMLPAMRAGGLGAQMLKQGLVGAVQGGSEGARFGGWEGAAEGALEGGASAAAYAGLGGVKANGGITRYLAGAANMVPNAAGVIGGVNEIRTAKNPAEAVEGATTAAIPWLAHALGRPARKAAEYGRQEASATGDLRRGLNERANEEGMKQAAMEEAAHKDVERTGRTEARNDLADERDTRATDLDKDRATYDAAKARASEAQKKDRLDDQNEADRLRTADDKMQRTRNEAVDLHRTAKESANQAEQLAAAKHAKEMADLNAEHARATQEWDAHIATMDEGAAKVAASIDAQRALGAMRARIQAAYSKETERLKTDAAGKGMTADEAARSAHAALGQVYGEAGTRLSHHVEAMNRGVLPEDPQIRADYKHAMDTLAKNHPSALKDFRATRTLPEGQWEEGEAQRRMLEANAGDPKAVEALKGRPEIAPDLDTQAAKAVADNDLAKRTLDPVDRKAIDAALVKHGYDPATVAGFTDEQIINRDLPPVTVAPPEPVAPDDSAYKMDSLNKRIAKLEAPRFVPPPKPDRLATTGAIRDANNARRNAPPPVLPPKPDAAGVRAANRTDAATIRHTDFDTIDSLPDHDAAQAKAYIDSLVEKKIGEGDANAKTKLDNGRDFARQHAVDVASEAGKRLLHGGIGAVGAGVVGGPIAAGAGALIGALTAKPSQSKGLGQFLQRSKGNAMDGKQAGFTNPAEAAAIYRFLKENAEGKSRPSESTRTGMVVGAADAAVHAGRPTDAAIRAYLEDEEKKRKERDARP